MSDQSKQARIEALLRKSLLGEELVHTQFHLYSARSSVSGRVVKPRVLCANNVLLAKSSTYFLDLLSSDIPPSDASLVDLGDDRDVPGSVPVDEYGYGSDSDLEECSDPVPDPKPHKDRPTSKDDDELSDDGSVSSDMFVMSPEQPREDGLFASNKDEAGPGSVASSETAVQESVGDDLKRHQMANAMRLRSLGSRHVLVKDTTFQTWYTLLNYLYTDKFSFSPPRSAMPVGQASASSPDEPKCSAKSMYRLARKVGLDDLCDEAFRYIQRNLTEHNILQELACTLVSTHRDLLDMELDVLYAHITSPTVVAGFPALAGRIANKELAHGADIVVGIHTRLLKASPARTGPVPVPLTKAGPVSVSEVKDEDELPEDRAGAGVSANVGVGEAKGKDWGERTGVVWDAGPAPALLGEKARQVPPPSKEPIPPATSFFFGQPASQASKKGGNMAPEPANGKAKGKNYR